MNSVALEVNGVWKKFKKGERYDSLRDLIPAAVKGVFSANVADDLKDKEFWALKDVSFQVKRGEALGIIGPNGSGKSTTLKVLSGILKPTKGKAKVNGRLSALIEVSAGFHPDLTGRENIYLNGAILGMRKGEIDRKFAEITDFSGLEDFIDTPVKRYSSGMYARLGFSVAAHVDPDILLVDEVLSVGDMSFQQRCMEKMQEKIKADVAVVFISHNLAAIASLCSRVIVLNRGELIADGSYEKALDAYVAATKLDGSKTKDGDTSIRILDVDFKAHGPHHSSVIQPHTPCELVVTFRCEATLPPFCVSFMIRRTQDLFYCYGATTEELGLDLLQCKAADLFTVRFQFDAHLTRGHYRLDLNIRDPKNARFIIESNGVASFTVDEQISYSGLVDVGLKASLSSGMGSGIQISN